MEHYIVAFKRDGDGDVEYFACWGDDVDHAKEQCKDAEPGAEHMIVYAPLN